MTVSLNFILYVAFLFMKAVIECIVIKYWDDSVK